MNNHPIWGGSSESYSRQENGSDEEEEIAAEVNLQARTVDLSAYFNWGNEFAATNDFSSSFGLDVSGLDSSLANRTDEQTTLNHQAFNIGFSDMPRIQKDQAYELTRDMANIFDEPFQIGASSSKSAYALDSSDAYTLDLQHSFAQRESAAKGGGQIGPNNLDALDNIDWDAVLSGPIQSTTALPSAMLDVSLLAQTAFDDWFDPTFMSAPAEVQHEPARVAQEHDDHMLSEDRSEHHSAEHKRSRFQPSDDARVVLERAFYATERYPDSLEVNRIARDTDMTVKQVRDWFNNKRRRTTDEGMVLPLSTVPELTRSRIPQDESPVVKRIFTADRRCAGGGDHRQNGDRVIEREVSFTKWL
jgi:hypothetical protein